MSFLRAVVVGVLACSPSSFALAAQPTVAVTTCGQTVPARTIGYLTADLDCTGFDGGPAAVLLNKNATLELRGFRITGGLMNVTCGEIRPGFMGAPTLYTVPHCAVVGGGGTVSNAGAHGVSGQRIKVSDLTVENAGQEGIYGNYQARLTNIVVTGSGGNGIQSNGSATIVGAHVSGSGQNGVVAFGPLHISDSTVLGSGTGPDCPYTFSCADIVCDRRPRVVDTQCGTSGGAQDWGVCASD